MVVPSWTEIVRETTCTYGGKKLDELVPAPTAGTEWKFRMVIRYGDVIGVQSLKQKGKRDCLHIYLVERSAHE